MIKNIQLLNLGKFSNLRLFIDTKEQRFVNKISYTSMDVESQMVVIEANQESVDKALTT